MKLVYGSAARVLAASVVLAGASALWVPSSANSEAVASVAGPHETPSEFHDQLEVVKSTFPELTDAEVLTSVKTQGDRSDIIEMLESKFPESYSGAWYDLASTTQHVSATDAATLAVARSSFLTTGVSVEGHQVKFSALDLINFAKRLNTGLLESLGHPYALASVAEQKNRVEVYANASDLSDLRSRLGSGPIPVDLLPRSKGEVREDVDPCVNPRSCGLPLRSGIEIRGPGRGGGSCSVGYVVYRTYRPSQKYYTTAGHCTPLLSSDGLSTYYHDTGFLGSGYAKCNLCAGYRDVDVAIHRIASDPVNESDSFGWLYNYYQDKNPYELDAITTGIQTGNVVCLRGIMVEAAPEPPHKCGIITDLSDGDRSNLVRISQYDACGGDSGGVWFYTTQSGRHSGWGSHSRSDGTDERDSCHGSFGGTTSWMTGMRSLYNWGFESGLSGDAMSIAVR